MKRIIFLACFTLILLAGSQAFAQTSDSAAGEVSAQPDGILEVKESAIASSGGAIGGGSFTIESTVGQAVAGQITQNGGFTIRTGYQSVIPTAPQAAVTVGGRVLTADNRGIRNVLVTITMPNGQSRTVLTGQMGYFRFADIPTGNTYVVSIAGKKFTFSTPTQSIFVSNEISNLNFVANN